MAKFDKYLLSQLLVLFGFFSLILVLVYWVNRAVVLFDQIIANGHSALVFLEFSALSIPNVIRLVTPMAAFAASLYCANRLSSESELVVIQSTGYSPFRLARPVLYFGVILAVFLSVLAHFLVPASLHQLALRQSEIETSASARLLKEGAFLHPTPGVTFYVGSIAPDGGLSNIFLSDSREDSVQTNYSAARAVLVLSALGPQLVMFDGMVQTLRRADQSLATTQFSEFEIDLDQIIAAGGLTRIRAAELATPLLLWPSEQTIKGTRTARAKLVQIGHERVSQALLTIVVSLLGFASILVGGFSRFSLWKQVLMAIAILIILKTLDNFMNNLASQDALLWPLVYLSSVLGLFITGILLWLSARPAVFSRRRRVGRR